MNSYLDSNDIENFEKILRYQFNNTALLQECLSHPSLKQLKAHKNYERMELLGDALLSFIIVELLYHQFVHFNEGDLAKIKSFLVSKEVLSAIAQKLQIADYLIMTKGEENSGGRENINNIENAMESLIAAIYLDSDIHTTKKIVQRLWQDYLHEFDAKDIDPKSTLQEWAQHHKFGIPVYEIIQKSGPDHAPLFTINAVTGSYKVTTSGNTVKNAEKHAAKKILHMIAENDKK